MEEHQDHRLSLEALAWWEKLPLALATVAQSVVVGFWYYRYIDLGENYLNIAIAIVAGLALDLIVVTTIMGRRIGRNSAWSMGASLGAFLCSALIAVDSYSDWLSGIRPLLHVSYPAMVFLYSQHLATVQAKHPQTTVKVERSPLHDWMRRRRQLHALARLKAPESSVPAPLTLVLSKSQRVKQLAAEQGVSESTIWRKMKAGELS